MQLDWLTIVAQIVNFLVLVWLLQRFLYRPITDAMRLRETRIEKRYEDATQARQQADDETQRLKDAQAQLDKRMQDILNDARRQAGLVRDKLEAEIREEMDEKRKAWREHLADEQDALIFKLRRMAGLKVLEISRRVLADYAGADLSERVIDTFAARVTMLDPDTQAAMREAASRKGATATVHSGTAIDSAGKDRITTKIRQVLSAELEVEYREDPDMVLGIRLTIGDYSVEWSAAHYLRRLETELTEIIDVASRSGGQASDLSKNDVGQTA